MTSSTISCSCLQKFHSLTCLYLYLHHFNAANMCLKTRECFWYLVAAVSHLTSQLLVLLHQFLVLLVDGQHFTDTVSSRLSLKEDQNSNVFHILYLFTGVLHYLIINS